MGFLARIGRYVRAHHVGLIAVFLALGGTAWALQNNSVRSRHIVNNQVRGADVKESTLGKVKNSGKVDGRNAKDLIRIQLAKSGNLPDPTGCCGHTMLTADITAPQPGFLFITGTVEIESNDGQGQFYELMADGQFVTGGNADTTDGFVNLSGSQPVAAGGHTVDFWVNANSASLGLGAGTLNAIFIPFNGQGQ